MNAACPASLSASSSDRYTQRAALRTTRNNHRSHTHHRQNRCVGKYASAHALEWRRHQARSSVGGMAGAHISGSPLYTLTHWLIRWVDVIDAPCCRLGGVCDRMEIVVKALNLAHAGIMDMALRKFRNPPIREPQLAA